MRFYRALLIIIFSMLSVSMVYADTDGTEMQIAEPAKLRLQLGSGWAGFKFSLKTDIGMYPAPVTVDRYGNIDMDLGGSKNYLLSINDARFALMPDPDYSLPERLMVYFGPEYEGYEFVLHAEPGESLHYVNQYGMLVVFLDIGKDFIISARSIPAPPVYTPFPTPSSALAIGPVPGAITQQEEAPPIPQSTQDPVIDLAPVYSASELAETVQPPDMGLAQELGEAPADNPIKAPDSKPGLPQSASRKKQDGLRQAVILVLIIGFFSLIATICYYFFMPGRLGDSDEDEIL
jgi:hypothetical protein